MLKTAHYNVVIDGFSLAEKSRRALSRKIMHHHKAFLDRFERGEAAVAFGVTYMCIGHWKVRGIPARYWPMAEIIAAEKGWPFTALSLSVTRPKIRRSQAAT